MKAKDSFNKTQYKVRVDIKMEIFYRFCAQDKLFSL